MFISENLELLERGELKFSCSYDEGDTFGDSCGSAESEEGSDSEAESGVISQEIEFVDPNNFINQEEDEIDLEVSFFIF